MDYLAGPFIYRQVCFARGRERGESDEVVKAQAGGTQYELRQAKEHVESTEAVRGRERTGLPSLQMEHSPSLAP